MTNQQFATDLRRTLYILQIAKTELKWLRDSKVCPSGLKQACINAERSAQGVRNSIMLNVSPANAAFIRMDLGADKIHDIANLVHEISDIDNIDAITEVIKNLKEEAPNQLNA